MLRARQALRIIDKFERATTESKQAALGPHTEGNPVSDQDSNSTGLNNTLPETGAAASGSLEPVQELSGERTLQRPPSHTAVDIPDLATRDSATVSSSITFCSCVMLMQHSCLLGNASGVCLTQFACVTTACSVL